MKTVSDCVIFQPRLSARFYVFVCLFVCFHVFIYIKGSSLIYDLFLFLLPHVWFFEIRERYECV